MKKYMILFACSLLLHSSLASASYYEDYVVEVKILKKLSDKKTNEIIKKYNCYFPYNMGVQVTVISAKARAGSYSTDRFKKGQIIDIVVGSQKDELRSKLIIGRRVRLQYQYEDSDMEDGFYSSTSWLLYNK